MSINLQELGDPVTERQVKRAKLTNIIALVTLFTMMLVVFFFFLELQDNKEALEAQRVELEEKNVRLKVLSTELEALKKEALRDKEDSQLMLDSIASNLESRNYDEARELAGDYQKSRNKPGPVSPEDTRVKVALYSNHVPHDGHQKLFAHLSGPYDVFVQKESLGWDKPLFERSTVVYFSGKMKKEAEAVQRSVGVVTGERFDLVLSSTKDFPAGAGPEQISVYYLLPGEKKPKQEKSAPQKESDFKDF